MFFFKQKTAYEMRISDWSSDVCSSDLVHDLLLFEQLGEQDVERDDRHDDENAERHLRNQAAFAKSGDEAVRIGARGGRGARGKNGHEHLALFLARSIFRTGDRIARGSAIATLRSRNRRSAGQLPRDRLCERIRNRIAALVLRRREAHPRPEDAASRVVERIVAARGRDRTVGDLAIGPEDRKSTRL